MDVDINASFSVDSSAKKQVERKDCQQDNDHNGYGSHTTARVFSHFWDLLLRLTAESGEMKIATYNVNSIRIRLDAILAWLEKHEPDVLCIQETKCQDDVFPALVLR